MLRRTLNNCLDGGLSRERSSEESMALVLAAPSIIRRSTSGETFKEGTKTELSKGLIQFEQKLAERAVAVAGQVLRFTITASAPCFDPKVFRKQFSSLRELCQIAGNIEEK